MAKRKWLRMMLTVFIARETWTCCRLAPWRNRMVGRFRRVYGAHYPQPEGACSATLWTDAIRLR
jgi:hypothetical protein